MQWLTRDDYEPAKCFFAHGTLPAFVDLAQPPTKRKPWSSIQSYRWIHTVNIVAPEEARAALERLLSGEAGEIRYAKVKMSLTDVLTGDFFNVYIKQGQSVSSGMHDDMLTAPTIRQYKNAITGSASS